MQIASRLIRIAVLALGAVAGARVALPLHGTAAACPPAHEGRAYCLLQHAWAPAAVEIIGCIAAAWLAYSVLARCVSGLAGALRRRRAARPAPAPAAPPRRPEPFTGRVAAAAWDAAGPAAAAPRANASLPAPVIARAEPPAAGGEPGFRMGGTVAVLRPRGAADFNALALREASLPLSPGIGSGGALRASA